MDALRIEELAGGKQGTRILQLSGPFTLANIFQFQEIARTDPSPIIIVDLTGVPYMDSAALGSLLGLHVHCQRDKRQYALVGVSDRLMSMLKVAGVDGILVSYPTLAEAEDRLGKRAVSA